MNQCLKISFLADRPKDFLDAIIKKSARELGIEGTVQAFNEQSINIVACSSKEALEEFLDILHKESGALQNVAIEPFLKNKDYRGVFRVLE